MTLYNLLESKKYSETAGKVTIATALLAVGIFAFVFLFNAGKTELMKVEAQGAATTTLTVLNTPPIWIPGEEAREEFESSSSTPTNSFSQISWVARADNSGGAPYFLLICSTNATPTANAASSTNDLGTAPPECNGGIQWGVSTATASMAEARVATTTTESGPFSGEVLTWYGFVCDDDPVNPRCNNTSYQGTNATNSSPFHVNFRPVLTWAGNDSPTDPGGLLTYYSTSTDGNVVRGPDDIFLYVCNGNDFVASTTSCTSGVLASTTVGVTSNATAAFTLASVLPDDVYEAYVFLVDEYNHPASGGAHATQVDFTVNNVAPTVPPGTIFINNGADLVLSQAGGQTTGFTLDFIVSDANSCRNSADNAYEITGYVASIFRNGIGTSTCDGTSGSYDPNNCYPSGVSTTTWNLACTASTTSCTGTDDPSLLFNCSFPLWFVAEPTDADSPYSADYWVAAIAGVDNNNATGTLTVSTATSTLVSFPYLTLVTGEIPYGSLEPGTDSGTLNATTTITSLGNTGLNQNLEGEAMCTTFSVGNPCPSSATSTVPENNQRFGTSSAAYSSGFPLSSTTPQLLQLKVPKTSSTTNPSQGVTYWGIGVPIEITLSGAYTGLNTFYGVISSSTDW